MIINSYIITYLLCSLISLFIGITASWNGFRIRHEWNINNPSEAQYHLEKKVYLIITIMSLGFLLRLLMIPLWFWTLHSMIVSIPGAMCLVGVHNIHTPYSYMASGLKLVLPALYGYWLILNVLDRQVITQPFMNQKLLFLAPLGMLILLETVLDISFFLSSPPRQVACCTSLFDVPRENIPSLVAQSVWIWLILFYVMAIFVLGEIIYFAIAHKKNTLSGRRWWFGNKSVMFGETLLLIVFFFIFLLSLHTKISPLFLHLPFHHCLFCLGQEVWDALISFIMIFVSLILLLIYFWTVSSSGYLEANPVLNKHMVKLLQSSGYMLAGGLTILSIHLFLVV